MSLSSSQNIENDLVLSLVKQPACLSSVSDLLHVFLEQALGLSGSLHHVEEVLPVCEYLNHLRAHQVVLLFKCSLHCQ